MKNQILPKLVVTGSEGLIGKHLVNHFRKYYEILKLDITLGHDLTNESFVAEWFRKNKNLYAMIVCHAYNPAPYEGYGKVEPTDVPLAEIRKFLEINTVSVFSICQNFIRNNKKGIIINLSSIYGKVSPRHDIYTDFVKPIGYSISKGTIDIMSKYLATYYAPNFIINTVVLGGIYDPKMKNDFVSNYSKNIPMKRMMNLDEVIPVFEFLLNKKSSYATGASFYIDGGWTAW